MSRKLTPSDEEQKEMNAEFDAASVSDRNRLGLLLIPISEFTSMLASIPEKEFKQYRDDAINTLIIRKPGKTVFGKFMYDILARAFRAHRTNSEKGKKGMKARWGTNSNNETK